MSDRPDPRACAQVQAEIGELALGILSGRERSEVLTHLDSCATCRSELDQLATVVDDLVHLAPEAEPPVGFESRVVQRFEFVAAGRRRHRRRRRTLSLVASAAAVVLGVGLALAFDSGGSPNDGSLREAGLVSTSLHAHGQVDGVIVVSAHDHPTWVFMRLDLGMWSGWARCEVTLADGSTKLLGRFWVERGYGAWAVQLSAPANALRAASVVDDNGTVLASGSITA